MNVGEICNRSVVKTEPDCSIQEAVNLMRRYHVGDVVVVEEREMVTVPVGILTDRDIVIEVLANDLSLDAVSIGDVMTRNLLTVKESDGIPETVEAMRNRGYRRVPVINNLGALTGILSLDDILEVLAEQMSNVAGLILREQQQEESLRH